MVNIFQRIQCGNGKMNNTAREKQEALTTLAAQSYQQQWSVMASIKCVPYDVMRIEVYHWALPKSHNLSLIMKNSDNWNVGNSSCCRAVITQPIWETVMA